MATPSNYVAIARRTLDMEDYIDVARRHIGWIVGPTFAGAVIGTVVAFTMQNVYVSKAVMRITPSQISENIVASTVNQRLTERIQQMQQVILSRTSLSTIIQDPRLDLYKNERAKEPIEDVIETMKNRDIAIRILELPGSILEKTTASAFSIEFSYPEPHKAQQVVQTLITKFQEVNLTTQRDQQNMVTSFVKDEMTVAKAQVAALDEQLTKFRVENTGKLPEDSQMNIAKLTALQQQANAINDSLNRQAQEKVQLDTHLETLQGQLELLGMFDKDQDVTGPAARQNERLLMMNRAVTDAESQLAQLQKKFKPTYPDVRDATAHLAEMKRQRDELQKQQDAEEAKPREVVKKKPTTRRLSRRARYKPRSTSPRRRNNRLRWNAPTACRNSSASTNKLRPTRIVSRKLPPSKPSMPIWNGKKAATEKLQLQQTKEDLAQQNNQVLQLKGGENLEQLDSPSLPEKPAKPDRYKVAGVGVGIGFVLGIALAGIQEVRDTSLKNLKDVRAYTNLPVLSSIPLLENTMLVRRKRRLAYLAWSAAVIIGLLAIGAALYYHATVLA